uniref:Small nuclear RNA activating complex polypeptide 4 n=1 Tax=Phocoena sinus TaxID=42100 RepID=A0A8C9B2S9_PHOSS
APRARRADVMDIDAERVRISKEIRELERILDPGSSSVNVDVSESSLDSGPDADSLPDEDSDAAGPLPLEGERWGEASNDEDDPREKALPEDPETCLQLNMVYQEVIREKLAEVSLLLARNREQQEEVMWELVGCKGSRVKDSRTLPSSLYMGHFMKPYFKDKVTGVGPPANEDTRERAAQGIKGFEELLVTKWKTWEKVLLRKSVVSDRLQRLLQPKLLKLEYLQQKQSSSTSEAERQILEKQAREAEKEVRDINQLPEESLLGNRLDDHDWEKISNVSFEGSRGAQEIRSFWQNLEHPAINKQEWSARELGQLQAIAAAHGHLHWQRIADELGTGRSAFQCLQTYQQHSPALKRKEWTEEEDRVLSQLVQEMRVGSHIPYRRIVYYMEGRDSMQLIYRWTKSLDPSLKKGLWAPEEDAKLLRAVAKYGEQGWFKIREEVPGRSDAQCRWARIASELPHRTGSQCLSKWKMLVRKRQRRRRGRRPPRKVRWSSSSGDSSTASSGDSGDSEPEAALGALTGGQALLPTQHVVPDVDLWVPARQRPCGACPRPPEGSDPAQGGRWEACTTASAPAEPAGQARAASGTQSTSLRGIRCAWLPCSGAWPGAPGAFLSPQKELRQPRLCSAAPGPTPGGGGGSGSARPCVRPLWHRTGQRRQGHALQRRLLEHQLLTAVSPWVGKVILPRTPRRPAVAHSRADGIRRQLQGAHLASTPVFTLFIQLFQIDTAGCMEVVRERKARPPTLLQAGARDSPLLQVRSEAAKKSTCHTGSGGPQACHVESTPQAPPPAPSRPRPKPKTVSELLREKRLREARARKAAQGRAVLLPQVLVSSPMVFQPLAPQGPPVSGTVLSGPGGPVAAASSALGSWGSAAKERPLTLQAFALAPASTGASKAPAAPAASRVPGLGPGQVPVSCRPSSLGQSQAPATSRKQGVPEAPPFLTAAPSPVQLPVQPLSLTPALGTHTAASTPLPVTWVLTAQGLLSVPVQAMVGLPRPAGTPEPQGLSVTLLPSPTATQAAEPPGTTSGPGEPRRPSGLEGPPPPWRRPEKRALDLCLLSQEGEAAVREWLRGQRGVRVPPLGNRLSYQPPTLCSLRTLSGLLLRKKALEHRAASLVPSGAAGALQASLGRVREQLRDSPAYLLLRVRFLATFALPALLATLSPRGVPTTLSVAMRSSPESDSDDSNPGQPELVAGQPGDPASGPQAAAMPAQVGGCRCGALAPFPMPVRIPRGASPPVGVGPRPEHWGWEQGEVTAAGPAAGFCGGRGRSVHPTHADSGGRNLTAGMGVPPPRPRPQESPCPPRVHTLTHAHPWGALCAPALCGGLSSCRLQHVHVQRSLSCGSKTTVTVT